MWQWFKEKWLSREREKEKKRTTLKVLIEQAKKSTDFIHDLHNSDSSTFWVTYFKTMIDTEILQKDENRPALHWGKG